MPEALGIALVDAGHFATERPMIRGTAALLARELEKKRFTPDRSSVYRSNKPGGRWCFNMALDRKLCRLHFAFERRIAFLTNFAKAAGSGETHSYLVSEWNTREAGAIR